MESKVKSITLDSSENGPIIIDNYIARPNIDGTYQTVKEHLINVSKKMQERGKIIKMPSTCKLIGLYHDFGKFQNSFQEYIKYGGTRGSVDHSSLGAQILSDKIRKYIDTKTDFFSNSILNLYIQLVNMVILSHHGVFDIVNCDTESTHEEDRSRYVSRINKELEELDVDAFLFQLISEKELKTLINKSYEEFISILNRIKELTLNTSYEGKKSFNSLVFYNYISNLYRMLLSIMLDSDYSDSMEARLGCIDYRIPETDRPKIFKKFHKNFSTFRKQWNGTDDISKLRNELAKQCDDFETSHSGIYNLLIPTGGGKTADSLILAFNDSIKHSKRHIWYTAPYISILEQSADNIRNFINSSDTRLITEYHSNIEKTADLDETENVDNANMIFDAPIICTTAARLLGIIGSCDKNNIRNYFQLANSVIIIDEIQSIPQNCFTTLISHLNILGHIFGSTILICSATIPELEDFPLGLVYNKNYSIITNYEYYHNCFIRSNIIDDTHTKLSPSELCKKVLSETKNNSLIVLNTKLAVKELYDELTQATEEYKIIYLTTNLCAKHRKDKIRELKNLLKENKKVICVSTQLIEAGVDISFERVYRNVSGLDSIIQANGRCNRNNEHTEPCCTTVIYLDSEKSDRITQIKQAKEVYLYNIRDRFKQLLDIAACKMYFSKYFIARKECLDYTVKSYANNQLTAYRLLGCSYPETTSSWKYKLTQPFRSVWTEFAVIDDIGQTGIIVPYGEKRNIYEELQNCNYSQLHKLVNSLQLYTVNVSNKTLEELVNCGKVKKISTDINIYILVDTESYSDDFGIQLKNDLIIF